MTPKNKARFAALLEADSLADIKQQLATINEDLTLPQAQKLTQRIRAVASTDAQTELRLGIVHTYTSDLLDPWLNLEAGLAGFELDTYHGPYGVTLQETLTPSGLITHKPDITLILMRWTDLHPDLSNPLVTYDAGQQAEIADEALTHLTDLLSRFRQAVDGQVVMSLLPSMSSPDLGLYDALAENSAQAWRSNFKQSLATVIRDQLPGTSLLDLDESLQDIGRRNYFDARLWHSSQFPFKPVAARDLCHRVMRIGTSLKRTKAKVIVLDADNTLWGGIIGEDGMTGIGIGPDYPGSAFVEFQKHLLTLQQRGFILAMCSKNNPEDVQEVLDNHPHQILKDKHFAAKRVNWEPKTQNLRSLADELNVGLDSCIFVDDSNYECLAVRQELPQVEVIQTPSKPLQVPGCLDDVARLEVLSLTSEDKRKTQMYAEQRQRRELETASTDLDSYLKTLGMKMQIGIDDANNLPRLAQLTQKTNQFNLTTRRYTEADVQGFLDAPDWLVAHFSLTDVFGDSGIVGEAMIQIDARTARLDNLLMSCRVIGRQAESAFLAALLRRLAEQGVTEIHAEYFPTQKNQLVKDFLTDHGFIAESENSFKRSFSHQPPEETHDFPIEIDFL